MLIDFSPLNAKQMKVLEFSKRFTIEDLKAATHSSIDFICNLIVQLTDEQIIFVAHDPEAEMGIGWNIAHMVVHVTASAEEKAAVSSILARGISYELEPRLRYEMDWKTVTTSIQCFQRLEESRRMRLAYLDAWPNAPHLNVYQQKLTERLEDLWGTVNAPVSYLVGLWHESLHFNQFREIIRQAITGTDHLTSL